MAMDNKLTKLNLDETLYAISEFVRVVKRERFTTKQIAGLTEKTVEEVLRFEDLDISKGIDLDLFRWYAECAIDCYPDLALLLLSNCIEEEKENG